MASQEEVQLLGFWATPFVYRVEWALKLKGVEYEYIEEDIFDKSPLLLELNPVHKKVPVLVHDQKVILESFLILEYIDETWKQCPLLPQDSRFWADLGEKKILDNAFLAMCIQGDEKEKAVKSSMEALERLKESSKGS